MIYKSIYLGEHRLPSFDIHIASLSLLAGNCESTKRSQRTQIMHCLIQLRIINVEIAYGLRT